MARINNQNTQQPKKVPITISGYPQAVQDMMRAKHPDYDQVMNQGMQGAPNGQIPAVAPQPASMNFFQPNGGAVGKFEAPAVQPQPAQPVQPVQTGEAPVTDFTNMPQQPTGWNADGTPSYDSLSSALSGAAESQKQEAPAFQSDPSKKDGGFFGWLGSLIPKKRPGMREGETPEEYDRRRTRNMEMMTTLADAIRHMGNIVNTSKGAPLQQFNDPTAMMEQGYQNRKAQRQKQAALDADAAYKQANLSLKKRAAEAAEAYKKLTLGYRDSADKRAQKQFEYQVAKDAAEAQYRHDKDEQNQSNWERQFNFRQQQATISNSLRQQSINKRSSGRSGGGGSGAGNSYPLYNPITGQTEHFKNEKSWIARAAELGYKTDTPSSSTTSQEVYSKDGIKKVSNTTRGNSVAAQIGKQTAQKKAAAKGKGKTGGGKPSGKLGGKKYH